MLRKVQFENFKKFKKHSVELKPFTVLMGENSSGKTSVLQAINLAMSILATQNFITVEGEKVKIRERGAGLTSLIGMNIADYRELYYGKTNRGGVKKGSSGATISLVDDSSNKYTLRITSLFGSYNVKCLSTIADFVSIPTLQNKPALFISGFVGLSTAEERAFPKTIQDRLRGGLISQIIRNLVLDIREKRPESFIRLQKRLIDDFDFYLDDDVSFNEISDLHIKAHFRDTIENNSISLDFNSSGSGFMQILQILAPIYMYCPDQSNIVLLDEPDAHLHPNLQKSLAKSLRDLQSELGIQIIISTHSTSIIKSADPSEIVPITFTEEYSRPLSTSFEVEQEIFQRIDSVDTYDLGKTVLSGKILFIEDQKTEIIEAFDKVLKTKCFYGANTIPTVPGRGKDDKTPYTFHQVIKTLQSNPIKVSVIRDNDGLDKIWIEKLFEYAKKQNVTLYVLERYEIENYILSPKLFTRTLQYLNQSKIIPSEVDIQHKMEGFLHDSINLGKYRYQDTLEDNILKTALLLNEQEIRINSNLTREALRIMNSLYEIKEFEELIKVGMGKQTIKNLFYWINSELKLKISLSDLLQNLDIDEIPQEIKTILDSLISREHKMPPLDLPLLNYTVNTNEE